MPTSGCWSMVKCVSGAGRSTATTARIPVAIPIGENDRFLTLAATDGGNGINWDWIMFGDPRLELAAKTTDDSTPQKTRQLK